MCETSTWRRQLGTLQPFVEMSNLKNEKKIQQNEMKANAVLLKIPYFNMLWNVTECNLAIFMNTLYMYMNNRSIPNNNQWW